MIPKVADFAIFMDSSTCFAPNARNILRTSKNAGNPESVIIKKPFQILALNLLMANYYQRRQVPPAKSVSHIVKG
jgi:hypothetical protein